ncbi:MAG TPA: ATP-binding protein [Candidatus Limnocylindrales bacterium]
MVEPRRLTDVFSYSVAQNWHDGVWVATLSGNLDLATHPVIRTVVEKCIADHPAAIVIDLHDTGGQGKLLLSVLATERRRAGKQMIPLVYTAGEALYAQVQASPLHRFVDVYPTLNEALGQARHGHANPWLHLCLEPGPLTSSLARNEVGTACLAWGLHHMLHPARVVVSELVSNAIQHTGSAVEVTASVAGNLLRIRVHDRSPEPPVLLDPAPPDTRAPLDLRGQGLQLVASYAKAWGYTPTAEGKIVWATLPIAQAGIAGNQPDPRRTLPST